MDKKCFEFEIKSVEENGVFTGYGSVFGNKDSHNHVVVKGAFRKTLAAGGRNGTGVVLLYQHRADIPIGIWKEIVEDSRGLRVVGQLAMETSKGRDVYELLKMGALKGLSIGYDTLVYEDDAKKKIRYLKELDLWEISLVTFGSNKKARITGVKEVGTTRELEVALRELSLSKADAQRAISFCKTCETSGGLSSGNIKAISSYLADNQYSQDVIGDAIALAETYTCGQKPTCGVTWADVAESVKALASELAASENEAREDLEELREAIEARQDTSGATEALEGFFRAAEKINLRLIRAEGETLENKGFNFPQEISRKLAAVSDSASDRITLLETMARAKFGSPVSEPEAEPKKQPLTALQNFEKNGIFRQEIPENYYDGSNIRITHGPSSIGSTIQQVSCSRAMSLHGSVKPFGFPT